MARPKPTINLDEVHGICGSVFGDGTYQVGTAGELADWYGDVAGYVAEVEFEDTHLELREATITTPINSFFADLNLHTPNLLVGWPYTVEVHFTNLHGDNATRTYNTAEIQTLVSSHGFGLSDSSKTLVELCELEVVEEEGGSSPTSSGTETSGGGPVKHLDKGPGVCDGVPEDGNYEITSSGPVPDWYREVAEFVVASEFANSGIQGVPLSEEISTTGIDPFLGGLDLYTPHSLSEWPYRAQVDFLDENGISQQKQYDSVTIKNLATGQGFGLSDSSKTLQDLCEAHVGTPPTETGSTGALPTSGVGTGTCNIDLVLHESIQVAEANGYLELKPVGQSGTDIQEESDIPTIEKKLAEARELLKHSAKSTNNPIPVGYYFVKDNGMGLYSPWKADHEKDQIQFLDDGSGGAFGPKTFGLDTPQPTTTTPSKTGWPTWTWPAVEGADKYEIVFDGQNIQSQTQTTYQYPTKLGNDDTATTHLIQVRAIGVSEDEVSEYGEHQFVRDPNSKLTDLDTPQPTTETPTHNIKPIWTWDAIPGATHYGISISPVTNTHSSSGHQAGLSWQNGGETRSTSWPQPHAYKDPLDWMPGGESGKWMIRVQALEYDEDDAFLGSSHKIEGGNTVAEYGEHTVEIDTSMTPPADDPPPEPTTETPTDNARPTWTWEKPFPEAQTYQTNMDGVQMFEGPSTTYKQLTDLSLGKHTLKVRASSSSTPGQWTVWGEHTVEILSAVKNPPEPTTKTPTDDTTPTWAWEKPFFDAVHYEVYLDGDWQSPKYYNGKDLFYERREPLSPGEHTIKVRAADDKEVGAHGRFWTEYGEHTVEIQEAQCGPKPPQYGPDEEDYARHSGAQDGLPPLLRLRRDTKAWMAEVQKWIVCKKEGQTVDPASDVANPQYAGTKKSGFTWKSFQDDSGKHLRPREYQLGGWTVDEEHYEYFDLYKPDVGLTLGQYLDGISRYDPNRIYGPGERVFYPAASEDKVFQIPQEDVKKSYEEMKTKHRDVLQNIWQVHEMTMGLKKFYWPANTTNLISYKVPPGNYKLFGPPPESIQTPTGNELTGETARLANVSMFPTKDGSTPDNRPEFWGGGPNNVESFSDVDF